MPMQDFCEQMEKQLITYQARRLVEFCSNQNNTETMASKNMSEKTFKKVWRCQNCGNEAEMTVTCALEAVAEESAESAKQPPATQGPVPGTSQKVKGHAVCSQCGNEAEMWLDRP